MDKRFPLEDQIEMLGSMIRGRVITPAHEDYDAMRQVALAQFDRRPAAIVRVANPADVAAVLNFAQATDLPSRRPGRRPQHPRLQRGRRCARHRPARPQCDRGRYRSHRPSGPARVAPLARSRVRSSGKT